MLFVIAAVLLLLILNSMTAAAQQTRTDSPSAPSGGNSVARSFQDALDNITEAIASSEGFHKAGSIPDRYNNPGAIKNAGGNGFQAYSDVGDGWDALSNWVVRHITANPDWDFYDMASYYLRGSTTAPPQDAQGDSDAKAEFIANYLGVDPASAVSDYLEVG